jgi:predicted nucleotidyltransferase
LFGSFIRNEQKGENDIDILVEFEKGKKTFDNYMGLKFFLENLLKCKVDLVISDALKHRIKPYIMREVEYAKGL